MTMGAPAQHRPTEYLRPPNCTRCPLNHSPQNHDLPAELFRTRSRCVQCVLLRCDHANDCLWPHRGESHAAYLERMHDGAIAGQHGALSGPRSRGRSR